MPIRADVDTPSTMVKDRPSLTTRVHEAQQRSDAVADQLRQACLDYALGVLAQAPALSISFFSSGRLGAQGPWVRQDDPQVMFIQAEAAPDPAAEPPAFDLERFWALHPEEPVRFRAVHAARGVVTLGISIMCTKPYKRYAQLFPFPRSQRDEDEAVQPFGLPSIVPWLESTGVRVATYTQACRDYLLAECRRRVQAEDDLIRVARARRAAARSAAVIALAALVADSDDDPDLDQLLEKS